MCGGSIVKKVGAPGGIRTPDTRIRSPVLYPAELLARFGVSPGGCSGDEVSSLCEEAPVGKLSAALHAIHGSGWPPAFEQRPAGPSM